MWGCVQLLPVSPVAREHARLLKKSTDHAERGWHLNRGEAAALDAIEAFCAGRLDEHTALAMICGAKGANALRARAPGAPMRCVTRRQKEVLRNVMRQHPSWYRAERNGERVTLASLFRAQLLERHAWRGQEGEADAIHEVPCRPCVLEMLKA
jgi:hypothetical protein